MRHHTKRHGKRMSSRRRGRRVMKGGFLQALSPSLYTDSANAIGAGPYETHVAGTLNQQMTASDSSAYAHSNALDYSRINPSIMQAGISGAASMQGGKRQNNKQYQNQYQNQQQYQNQFQQQNQKQYQNQQQNQKGGVWNQMIGEAVAPLVLLGLQQYYGPRSKSNRGTKGKRTRRFRK